MKQGVKRELSGKPGWFKKQKQSKKGRREGTRTESPGTFQILRNGDL